MIQLNDMNSPTLKQKIRDFQEIVYDHFSKNSRDFPWRQTRSPYKILVSEFMLQQTQTERVIPKYIEFLETLPTITKLAYAQKRTVFKLWQGLGYNRRAVYLWETAKNIVDKHSGNVPCTYEQLIELPGIGPYTASAVLAFAFDQPTVFIETNIRTAFLHCFFQDSKIIHDKEILPIIERSLDRSNVRNWYYALMDYGNMLKKTVGNINRTKSKQYTTQAKFKGSVREARGAVIRLLTKHGRMHKSDIIKSTPLSEGKLSLALKQLVDEKLIAQKNSFFFID